MKSCTLSLRSSLRLSVAAALAAAALAPTARAQSFSNVLQGASLAWTHVHAATNGSTAGFLSEIVAHDRVNGQLWVSGVTGIDVLDATTGSRIDHINTSAFGSVNSVAIHNGVAALALEASTRTSPGTVQFYDTTSRQLTGSVTVGALPDMLTFTPDGSRVLVANEGTPSTYGARLADSGGHRNYGLSAQDPAGSVSIIDVRTRTVTATATLGGVATTGTHLRTNTGMDAEPEYIAVNRAGTQAYVSLQEANGMGVLDLQSGTFSQVVGLGAKDFSAAGNSIDPLNNGTVKFSNVNAKGLYMPDGVATMERNGQTFVLMANEGDFREDDADRSSASSFGGTGELAALRVSNTDSSTGNLFAAGARSFSIRDAEGNLVYDSGDILDKAAFEAGLYDDNRSRDKGVEPEGIEVLTMNGRTIAFVGLERTTQSAVASFDVTDPTQVSFLRLLVASGQQAPEGLEAFEQNGRYYLAWSAEGGSLNPGNRTTVFDLGAVAAVPEPGTYSLLLTALGLGAVIRRWRAKTAV